VFIFQEESVGFLALVSQGLRTSVVAFENWEQANAASVRVRPNPSIERTSKRLRLFAAAHVER
jgi:hypothetical protein